MEMSVSMSVASDASVIEASLPLARALRTARTWAYEREGMRETAGLSLRGPGDVGAVRGAGIIGEERGIASWASMVASPAAGALVGLGVPGAGVESATFRRVANGRPSIEEPDDREGSLALVSGGGDAGGGASACDGAEADSDSPWFCPPRRRRDLSVRGMF
jgi:hypothetical protein